MSIIFDFFGAAPAAALSLGSVDIRSVLYAS